MAKTIVLLIGGTSHVGKSTLGKAISEKLNWSYLSTDSLARHPGRPWKTLPETVPKDVQEHYLSLSTEALFVDVIGHYERVWPLVTDKIAALPLGPGLVIEGSALWPDLVASLPDETVSAVWLTASDDLLKRRIYSESGFARADKLQRELITKFLERTLYFNRRMIERISHLNLRVISINASDTVEEVCGLIVPEYVGL